MSLRQSKVFRIGEIALGGGAVSAILGGIWVASTPDGIEAWYAAEDGLIETLTVAVLLLGAMLMFWFARIRVRKGPRRIALLLGMLMLFGAGEELSWGQRIFDVESPTFFEENNAQGETNLHNLTVRGVKLNKLIFSTILGIGIGAYLTLLPAAYRNRGARRAIDRLGLPVPRLRQAALILLCLGTVELIDSDRRWEVLEFAMVSLLLATFVRPANVEELAAAEDDRTDTEP
jgi:hypothetical protein